MTPIVAILVVTLLVTGVATATVYAVPILQQTYAAQTQNGERTQSQDRLQLQDCAQSGEMTQTHQWLQLRDCAPTCDGACEGPCACNQGDSAPAMSNAYQNHVAEQTCLRAQHQNRLSEAE
jgi:hypothetical protein